MVLKYKCQGLQKLDPTSSSLNLCALSLKNLFIKLFFCTPHIFNELTHIVHFTAVGSINLLITQEKKTFELNTAKSAFNN